MTTSRAWSFIPSEVWPPRGLWSNGINIRRLWRCGVERKVVVALAVFGLLFAACGGTTPAAQASPTVTATASAKPTATESPGAFIAARLNNDIPGINTTKLPAGVTIKTWKDLCNPALSGKIAVEQGDVVVYSALRKILGDAEAQNVLKCIAANKPSLRSGHTDMANLLAAGEFAATLSSNG